MMHTCHIIPPHLLRRIALNGSPAQRAAALATMATDQTVRLGRATYQLMEGGAHKVLMTTTATAKQRTIYDARGAEALPGNVVRNEGASAAMHSNPPG